MKVRITLNNMKNNYLTIIITALTLSTVIPVPVTAESTITHPANGKMLTENALTRADKIAYQYKEINGILYKRLYNFTAHKALSDWIRV